MNHSSAASRIKSRLDKDSKPEAKAKIANEKSAKASAEKSETTASANPPADLETQIDKRYTRALELHTRLQNEVFRAFCKSSKEYPEKIISTAVRFGIGAAMPAAALSLVGYAKGTLDEGRQKGWKINEEGVSYSLSFLWVADHVALREGDGMGEYFSRMVDWDFAKHLQELSERTRNDKERNFYKSFQGYIRTTLEITTQSFNLGFSSEDYFTYSFLASARATLMIIAFLILKYAQEASGSEKETMKHVFEVFSDSIDQTWKFLKETSGIPA